MSYFLLAGLFVLGHVFTRSGEAAQVGGVQYWLHSIYAVSEPTILRITDFLIRRKLFTDNALGKAKLRFQLVTDARFSNVDLDLWAAKKGAAYFEKLYGIDTEFVARKPARNARKRRVSNPSPGVKT